VRIKPLGESGGVDLLAAAVDERPESRGLMMAISPQSPEKIKTADNRGCHAGSTALAADEIALMQLSPVECELFWMRPPLADESLLDRLRAAKAPSPQGGESSPTAVRVRASEILLGRFRLGFPLSVPSRRRTCCRLRPAGQPASPVAQALRASGHGRRSAHRRGDRFE
jgi:hypothetical protein